jgi:hypothetical protein
MMFEMFWPDGERQTPWSVGRFGRDRRFRRFRRTIEQGDNGRSSRFRRRLGEVPAKS